MKRLAALLALVPLAAACGASVDESAPNPTEKNVVFLARTAGAAGPLTGYDASLGRRFELPGGIRAADGSAYYAMAPGELRRFSPNTGVEQRSYPVESGWKLAGVSATGRWVALTRGRTDVLVLNAESGATAHELSLRGNFLVETVSADGDFLFLQENYVDGSYAVRGYDLAAGQMLPGSLATKGETVLMEGVAAGTVASPDGRWLLTLYVDTEKHKAFVHALNLIDRIPLCIDMPPCVDCTVAQLRRWALALAPDGRTLFAANPDVGRVAEIHLPTAKLVYQSRFAPNPGEFDTRAAVAPDGGRLVFTNGDAVWSYDTHRGWAEKLRTGVGPIADLGISRDGSKLFLARLGTTPVALALQG
jgi:hypothetical protein